MHRWRSTAVACAAAPVLVLAACGTGDGDGGGNAPDGGELSGSLTGAGATFPTPVFQEWQQAYGAEQPGVSINYQSIGSGGGIEQFLESTVDFGSSERYLDDVDLSEARQSRVDATGVEDCEPIQFPVLFGSVVIAFNDQDLDGMVLTAETIAKIFDREITNYSDPELAELNPDMDLPDQDIVPVHRSDGSGTTYVFTHYLSHEVDEWAENYGEGTEVQWASGTVGGQGNEGVSANINQNTGALGYVNQAYALEAGMPQAQVINADGEAVYPTLEATTEASEEAEIPEGFQFDIDDIGGTGYPIAGTNWIFTYECGYDETTGEILRDYWTWAVTSDEARELALELGYAPMGEELAERVTGEIERINSKAVDGAEVEN
ncbi:phosphate ABC transporter substrate-binding protein PstS [Haloechinothrix sp. LS1_15]|uniref:phosphate ABC transporter substrate-binding protein PstS n=1 Tax=Haloechinothrix sp. LS1_15 TaxID=2652248 RepID=UPI0029451DA8|nr:phosphate ABC transporter substrate-binding protein PstS [Haloechinothrix sp. LS1_15]MDV6013006.1 phosphate ABC transporter substrate-binding protein PstS [Haloechinothrix sp. LS1_15]